MDSNVCRLRSRAARFALAALMLFAVQVALAEGLCRGLMLRGALSMNVGAMANEHDDMLSPCCGDMSQSADCRSSLTDAMTIGTPPHAKPFFHFAGASLPPILHAASTCRHGAPRAPPDARAARPLPVYLRFGRFLS